MNSSITKHQKTLSAIIHLSTFSKYFIPFGNFILPLVLWTSNKNDSDFVDYNGKQALNFQISILLYSLALGAISVIIALFSAWEFVHFVDIFEHNTHQIDIDLDNIFHLGSGLFFIGIIGSLLLGLLVLDVFCTILATIKAKDGIAYKYPLTINFLK
ncbi:DUF4870 domain-containing protein [Zhouia amylolytica]|uniref:DUF4870 domain-containing protein n=1 Tax=Zhouia amylolytica AD3 TaxID=1286632 RepID=W2USQ7_9FLAO|nr:DUF4870 domain-containing protein [Zhouia amylolytica]ETN96511.1 hypothetical protein P278_05890 [Zhouia amylolytica AD3]MCQ0110001.1 DUF4870 domain-containing protein [Zhouia amylolytica]